MVRRKLDLLEDSILEFINQAILTPDLIRVNSMLMTLVAHLWPWFALGPLRSIWSSSSSLSRPPHLSFEASQARNSLGPLRISKREWFRVFIKHRWCAIRNWPVKYHPDISMDTGSKGRPWTFSFVCSHGQSISRMAEIKFLLSNISLPEAPPCLVTWTSPA